MHMQQTVSIYIKRNFAPLEQRLQYLYSLKINYRSFFNSKAEFAGYACQAIVQTAIECAGVI
jgi:hypothetical protein